MNLFFIFRINITAVWRRDVWTIFRPIWISIWFLWLEAGSSNTTTANLCTARSVSTIRRSQLVPITQTPEFAAILGQRVQNQTSDLNEKNERLTTDYEEFHLVVMEMRSHMVIHVFLLIGFMVSVITNLLLLLLLLQHRLYFRFIVFELKNV